MTAHARDRQPGRTDGPTRGGAPVFSRSGFDRSALERGDDGLVLRLRADASSRVLVVRGDRAQTDADGSLRYRRADEVRGDAQWAFLGRSADGAALLAAVLDPDGPPDPDRDDEAAWTSVRTAGAHLSAQDADALVTAVALGRWLREAPFCPACGNPTRVRSSGWARVCDACGREHFPRTDPAVIMTVESASHPDRLLLGSNVLWGPDRYSCFAGFVEAGESAEAAVARELREEAGIAVRDVRYRSSQAWPYPRSLMLGFRAVADDDLARPDGDEIAAVRWFTRDEIGRALRRGAWDDRTDGEGIRLPGPASIAHRLIADWHAETA